MSKVYFRPKHFSPEMEAIVFIILQIFFATRAVLKIEEYLTIILRNRAEYIGYSPVLAGEYSVT